MDDDLQNLQLDRPGRGKSVEQIKKHTIDSGIENKPIERSVYLLTKGDDIQKLSVIQALPQLLQTEPHATYSRVIPKILQELPNSSCEFHVMTSKVFRSLMEKQVPVNLLHAVLQSIESRDPIVANAWMETLLSIIPVLTETQLKNEIIPLACCKSLLSQPISSRIASCRILGRLATHCSLNPMDVKRDILPLVQSLCQDCHPDVRTAMCIQLPQVGQGLGTGLVKSNLLTSLVELASDENTYVRSAAITATVQMFPHTTLEIKKSTILPLVKQLCEKSLRSDDITATTMSREIGKLVDGLQLALTISDSIWFLHCYKTLARRGLATDISEYRSADASLDVVCRQHCASNLPSMSYFTFAVMPGQVDLLYTIFRELAADPCYMVRRTVAACIHEIVKIFGPQSKMLKSDLVRLLRDDSEDVLQMLVPHVGTSLETLCSHGTLSRQSSSVATVEIGRAMLKCQYELTSGWNWRLLTHFIHQLEHLPNCMPPDFIHQHFTPVVLSCAVQGRAKPVRSQAVRTLLVFLRYNGKEIQRRWLRESLISQLCYSKCCYTRHIFIRLCINAIDIFSEKYFKDHFYENLLDLADDPVANIRFCVVSLFGTLKQMLILPDDQLLYDRLNDVFQKFNNEEKDRDVLEIYRRKMEEIKRSNLSLNKEEHEKEQKKRREEEDKVMGGGKSNPFLGGKKSAHKQATSRPGSVTKHSSSREFTVTRSNSGSQRSVSVPTKTGQVSNQSNDMNFLEQHFYIDAGVNLPTKSLNNNQIKKSASVNNFISKLPEVLPYAEKGATSSDASEESLEKLTELSCNITDDDKVNLRKLADGNDNNSKAIPRKNKRYSSIFSTTCLEKNQERKSFNRRSLNITMRETSKIPVSRKGSTKCINISDNKKSSKGSGSFHVEDKVDICDNATAKINIEQNNLKAIDGGESGIPNVEQSTENEDKSNNSPLENNNTSNECSFKSVSHLPVLKRRSVSEVRKPFT